MLKNYQYFSYLNYMGKINLESSWLKILNDEFEKPYMKNLSIFLNSEKKKK